MDSRIAAFVAIGGVAGAGVRWAILEAASRDGWWPWGVFVANVVGCLVLGVLVATLRAPDAPMALGLTVGFCGALTTFSSFAVDLALWLDEGEWARGLLYLAVSFAAGGAAFFLGRRLGPGAPSW